MVKPIVFQLTLSTRHKLSRTFVMVWLLARNWKSRSSVLAASLHEFPWRRHLRHSQISTAVRNC